METSQTLSPECAGSDTNNVVEGQVFVPTPVVSTLDGSRHTVVELRQARPALTEVKQIEADFSGGQHAVKKGWLTYFQRCYCGSEGGTCDAQKIADGPACASVDTLPMHGRDEDPLRGSSLASECSPSREASPMEGVIEEMQLRIRKLERWLTVNTVLWTFLMSALVAYSLYQRKRQ
ncbi:hypothetical protein K1719_046606 [Acacia pycnantha]|nr:hypothetical protein K1719_046606 [Acacia pycnantha]